MVVTFPNIVAYSSAVHVHRKKILQTQITQSLCLRLAEKSIGATEKGSKFLLNSEHASGEENGAQRAEKSDGLSGAVSRSQK